MDVDVDPSLVRWGEESPNQRTLAREFCLADNFYAEVPNSDVGRVFLTAGHLTEFVEHFWKEDAQYGTNPAFPLRGNLSRLRKSLYPFAQSWSLDTLRRDCRLATQNPIRGDIFHTQIFPSPEELQSIPVAT